MIAESIAKQNKLHVYLITSTDTQAFWRISAHTIEYVISGTVEYFQLTQVRKQVYFLIVIKHIRAFTLEQDMCFLSLDMLKVIDIFLHVVFFLHGIYRYIFEFDMTGFYSKIIRYRIHIYIVLRLFNYKYKNVTKMNTVNNALIMTHLLILENL